MLVAFTLTAVVVTAWSTTWVVEPVAAAKTVRSVGTYDAVTACPPPDSEPPPDAVNAGLCAAPLATVTGVPASWPSTANCTVPEGVPPSVTVAVTWTAWPKTVGLETTFTTALTVETTIDSWAVTAAV
jgi:hypothetical protein